MNPKMKDTVTLNRHNIDNDTLSLLVNISRYLKNNKIKSYTVGGFIRDTLLGRSISDIDIAISGDVFNIGGSLASHLKGKFIKLDQQHKICRIVFSENPALYLDLSSYTGTIAGDLKRRDFTINAMAIDLDNLIEESDQFQIIDPFQGILDLDHGIIRAVGEDSLSADPIRLLRAMRFAAELGFTIEHKTERLIKQSADLISTIAGERLREELLSLMEVSRGGHYLKYMEEFGLLTGIVPELQLTKGVTQPSEHYWDVFEHSLMTVTAVDYLLGQGIWEYSDDRILTEVPWSPELARYFDEQVVSGSTRRTLLKLAALLHDISKPQAKTVENNGKMRFLGHSDMGAAVAASILERLRFSSKEINLVSNVVKYHLRPNQMGQPPSRHAVYRYFRDVGEAGLDVLYVSLADHLATRGPSLIMTNWREHAETIRHILDEFNRQKVITKPMRFIDGNDLINIYGLKPGPEMGLLLEKLKEGQATGELVNRQSALDYVKNFLREGK